MTDKSVFRHTRSRVTLKGKNMLFCTASTLICKHKLIKLLTVLCTVVVSCLADMSTSLPTLPIESGYGAHGTWECTVDSIVNPRWKNHSVYLFHPKGENVPVPVILFCHGIGAENPQVYFQLIEHCVSRGYAVLYSPFKKNMAMRSPIETYQTIWQGFESGVKSWGAIIDTTRIGFLGHSYGAGAIPAFTLKAVKEKQWGKQGVFMYMMAPWYSYQISQEQLISFPSDVKLIVEIFDADRINDHRMAIDIFNNISISSDEKDFIIVESDTCGKNVLVAGHGVPEGVHRFGWDVNALDYYGVYRLVDALADYTFNKNNDAKSIALGGGCDLQKNMGAWQNGTTVKKLCVTDKPVVRYPQSFFLNFWNHAVNPRAQNLRFFDSAASKSVSSSTTIKNYKSHLIYPKKILSETEEYLESQGINRSVDNEYEGDGDPNVSTPDSIDDKDMWPISPITSGYGTKGKYKVRESFFPHPAGGQGNLLCFAPVDYQGLMPVILFAPRLNAGGEKYRQLLIHIASQGYRVIASTYRYGIFGNDVKRYDALIGGFEAVLETEKSYIDTTRIGFVGHSYGAGAIPAVSWYYLVNKKWGSQSAFLFLMSPSYVYCFTDEMFAQFPSRTNLVIEVYEDDHVNDHRIAEDIFYSINIHPSQKEFLFVRNISHGSFSYNADFQLPECDDEGEIEPLQEYAIFRQFDALAARTFENDNSADYFALGNGTADQVYMGKWWDGTPVRSLVSTDIPVFRNLHWLKPIMFLGVPTLINSIWPVAMLSSFDDKRNDRRRKFVP